MLEFLIGFTVARLLVGSSKKMTKKERIAWYKWLKKTFDGTSSSTSPSVSTSPSTNISMTV